MAFKTLRETLLNTLIKNKVYLSAEQTKELEFELRDFFAHETMKAGKDATAMDLFDRIFKDIPAYRGDS